MVDIDRISVQKQCDVLNKLKLLEARQETAETIIRGFEHREADAIVAKARIPVQSVNSRMMPKHTKRTVPTPRPSTSPP